MTTNQRILLAAFKVGRSIAIATKTIKGVGSAFDLCNIIRVDRTPVNILFF
jgi:hypothetical protein